MGLSPTVVAYDATDRRSQRHILNRNGPHVAVCGRKLQPFGSYRYLEGFDTDHDSPEADCRPCLFTRASGLASDMFKPGSYPQTIEAVNATDDLDEKVVHLLRLILNSTSWTETMLIREHFPRVLVERAAV